MNQKLSLRLYEEIMLLALHDEKGTISSGSYGYAIGGAILAELLLTGHLQVEEDRKKKFVRARSSESLDDPILDECLEKVLAAKRRASLETWVSRFATLRDLKHRVARRLCDRGILRADEDKVLWIFSRKIYPEIDPVPEQELLDRLRQAIFTEEKKIDARTVVLVSLAKGADLLRFVFDRKELKTRKDRIERLVNGEATGKATKDAVEAMEAAVMVAVIMPAIITTTVIN